MCDDFDLCGICYGKALEIKGHKNTHQYHVITKLDFPIFDLNWSAKEELLLFEGLEKYGFGNWIDISSHIATDKTKQECCDHYHKYYLSCKGMDLVHPLPVYRVHF